MMGSGVVFLPSVEGSQQCWLPRADASNHRRSSMKAPSFGAISVANMYSNEALHGQKLSMMTSTGTSGALVASTWTGGVARPPALCAVQSRLSPTTAVAQRIMQAVRAARLDAPRAGLSASGVQIVVGI